jgi:hypothetical protein
MLIADEFAQEYFPHLNGEPARFFSPHKKQREAQRDIEVADNVLREFQMIEK